MPFDAATGVELEVLLPAGMSRRDLLERLAGEVGGSVEPFTQGVAVPLPREVWSRRGAGLLLTAKLARHHGALDAALAEDGRTALLALFAGRLLAPRGRPLLSVVHDPSLPGGERVAELVTVPFLREGLPWVRALFRFVGAIRGLSLPRGAALHVHVDGKTMASSRHLARLVRLFTHFERTLRRLLHPDPAFTACRSLPPGLAAELERLASRGATLAEARALLRRRLPSPGFALNLFHLAAVRADKRTVELRAARATLDPDRLALIRELLVGSVAWARGRGALPRAADERALRALLPSEPAGGW